MRWLKVQVHVAPEAEEAVAHLLQSAGADGVMFEEEGGESILTSFFAESRQGAADDLDDRVRSLEQHGLHVGTGRVTKEWVTDEDWAEKWKQDYHPLPIGERLYVKPAWLADPPEAEGRLVIELDPGMAFGTGYHPTTALCLEALDEFVSPDIVVADVGTGSGILAIAAARLGARRVVAVDTLAETVPIAEENCRRNGVADVVQLAAGSTAEAAELLGGDGDERIAELPEGEDAERGADLIVVNILARVIKRLAPELRNLLRPGGTFIFSGIIEHAAEDLAKHLQEHGLEVREDRRHDEWSCLIGQRRD